MCLRTACRTNEIRFPYLSHNYIGYRTSATTAAAEFISHSAGERDTLHSLVNSLLARLGDDSVVCRTQACAGLGNIAVMGAEEVARYAAAVISALIAGLDDAVEDVATQAFGSHFRVRCAIDISDHVSHLQRLWEWPMKLALRPCLCMCACG